MTSQGGRSEEHTSELQSLTNLVCRLLLEKNNRRVRLLPALGAGRHPTPKLVPLCAGEESEPYPAVPPEGKRTAYNPREGSKPSAFHLFGGHGRSGKARQLT